MSASLRESEALLRTLEGHTHVVNAVAVTPDGQRAISASTDDTLDNISWGDCVIQDQDRNDLTGTETSAGQALPDTD